MALMQRDGINYFTAPEVRVIGATKMVPNFGDYVESFKDEAFSGYLQDNWPDDNPELLVKLAGQLCYQSFSSARTINADLGKYVRHILSSGHGSVLEHVSVNFLIWGVSRSLTHELVRHRVGIAYSQVSQRYCDAAHVRFVMRPEYFEDVILEVAFFERCRFNLAQYQIVAERLLLANEAAYRDLTRVERTKAVNQAARSVLPNETETALVCTMNLRTLRHILHMRGSRMAESEIRRLAVSLFESCSWMKTLSDFNVLGTELESEFGSV